MATMTSTAYLAATSERSQQTTVTLEERDAARIAGRRDRAEVRRERFLDARTRTIGVDVEALEAQRAAKAAAAYAEREADVLAAEEMLRIDRAVARFSVEQEAAAAATKAALKAEWEKQLIQTKMQPDYHLRDPHARRHDKPARVGDDDPRLGPSGAQKFAGEDLHAADRRFLQQQQLRGWVEQQAAVREQERKAEKEQDKQYAAYLREVEEVRAQIEASIQAQRKAERQQFKEENLRLAEQRVALLAQQRELERKLDDIDQATLAEKLLAERPEDGISAVNPNRVRRDHYRGMPAEALEKLLLEQEEQRAAAARKRAEERQREYDLAQEQLAQLRAAARAEVEAKEAAKRQKESYLADLRAQQMEREERLRREREASSQPGFGAAFFGAFGRSDR